MNEFLKITSLTKVYGRGKLKVVALKNISFSVFSGDFLGIVGPSGAGKSTLLHIMGGLEPPTEGEVVFRGRDISCMKDKEISRWRNKVIGFVFQFYHLIEELNVRDNIALPLMLGGRKFSWKKAEELLKYLDIEDKRNSFPSQLSGGERQKVAIARAIVNEPEIILCDEPTGNLDRDSQDKIIKLLERLNEEMFRTIILVTHNIELAKRAKRTMLIRGGETQANGEEQ